MISIEDTDQASAAVSNGQRINQEDLSHSFEVVLKDLPEVLLYIKRLNEHIKKQQDTLFKLYEKLKEYKLQSCRGSKADVSWHDSSTQTNPLKELPPLSCVPPRSTKSDNQCLEWTATTGADSGLSLADEVKRIAENAMQQTGFVYEETSGMYYDYNTGYYYNAEMGLYYDGNSGTYLLYNEQTKTYQYHSHAAVPLTSVTTDQAATPAITTERIATAVPVAPTLVKDFQTLPDPIVVEQNLSPQPLVNEVESEEDDLHIPGSNPMAPVLSESSSVNLKKEQTKRESLKKGSRADKESKHEQKKRLKHKKHKSKKKKKKRHRSLSKSEKSMEEGECSQSSGSIAERENDLVAPFEKKSSKKRKEAAQELVIEDSCIPESNIEEPVIAETSQSWKKLRRFSDEASEAWPPCMRIIVQSSEVKNLRVGTLFIVTCKGGTLGREKSHAVSIPDINISKHHGKFSFDESNGGKYYLIDYGSRNGTYVNNQRLSSAKQESEPCEISHGTIITLGSTNLLCHIHPGIETCTMCEPGVVAAQKVVEDVERAHISTTKGESKAERRLRELRRLRKRFGLEGNETKAELLGPGYEDRAEIRRVTVGSHNEHAKTEVASATESIRCTNKGFKMLSKMGWKEGESLGRDGTGLTEPVLVSQRADKVGLGADNAFAPALSAPASRAALDRWTRARQRYGQLPDTRDGDQDGLLEEADDDGADD